MTEPTTEAGRRLLDDPLLIDDLLRSDDPGGADRYIALIEAEARADALREVEWYYAHNLDVEPADDRAAVLAILDGEPKP